MIEDVRKRYTRKDLEILVHWSTDPDLIVLCVGAETQQMSVGQKAWHDALRYQFHR